MSEKLSRNSGDFLVWGGGGGGGGGCAIQTLKVEAGPLSTLNPVSSRDIIRPQRVRSKNAITSSQLFHVTFDDPNFYNCTPIMAHPQAGGQGHEWY